MNNANRLTFWSNAGLLLLLAVILIAGAVLLIQWERRQDPAGSAFWTNQYYRGTWSERQQAVGVLATRRPYDVKLQSLLVHALRDSENGTATRILAALSLHECGLASDVIRTVATNDANPEVRAAMLSILQKMH